MWGRDTVTGDSGDLEGLGQTEAGTETQREEMGRCLAPCPPHPHLTGPDVSQHQGHHQDEHGWPPVNTTTRPWRSAPPSPPPPGTRHSGTLTRPGSSLTLVPTSLSFLIPLPRPSPHLLLTPHCTPSALTPSHLAPPPLLSANFSGSLSPTPPLPSPGAPLGLPALPAD